MSRPKISHICKIHTKVTTNYNIDTDRDDTEKQATIQKEIENGESWLYTTYKNTKNMNKLIQILKTKLL